MADRPNVVFVFADQHRAEALGSMGNDQVSTPNLDSLAADGVQFTHAYTNNPVCSPARGCILTGRQASQHGVIHNSYFDLSLPHDEVTIADQLGEAGYRNGYVGKWHLDGGKAVPGYVPPGPARQGFEDYWRGFDRGHEYHKGHPIFDEDGDHEWIDGYQPTVQTDLAIEFVESASDGADPFNLFVSWGPPHTPFDPPAEYADLYGPEDLELRPNVPEDERGEARENLADYYGLVTSLDDEMGRLLDALEAQGVAEETIVVFTADHGEMMGSHGRYGKDVPQEESIHVPLLVRYPEAVEGGREVDAPVSLIDLMPTLCSLGGAAIPEAVQGRDLSATLTDGAAPPEQTGDGVYIQGDLPWDSTWRALRTRNHLFAVDRQLETMYLFDCAADPYQQENLAGEDDVADLEADLRERLFAAMDAADDRYPIARRERHRLQAGEF